MSGLVPQPLRLSLTDSICWLFVRYKFIRSPLFVMENQYDSNQIFAQELVPHKPGSATESEMVDKYIVMYGEAMRNSTAQVLRNAPLTKKPQPDGLFHPSCLAHGISATLNGTDSLAILGDWFFEKGKLTALYRLVESCPASAHGLPCNLQGVRGQRWRTAAWADRGLRGGAGQGPMLPVPGRGAVHPVRGAAQGRSHGCGLHAPLRPAVLRGAQPRARLALRWCADQGRVQARCRHESVRAVRRGAPS